jgi:biotin synthase
MAFPGRNTTLITYEDILFWLREPNPSRLADLWQQADQLRQQYVGGEVHLRGLVEISNYCVRLCAYCGLRAPNLGLTRYRMSEPEILQSVRHAVEYGYGTVVLQSGEDPDIAADWMADLVRRIKTNTPLAVTLSLGERTFEELALWRAAGADRYLLRFETSNPALYQKIHPSHPDRPDRLAILRRLRELGYQVGSGVMIGIPGQTYEDLAHDIQFFAELDLDMIGVGPYLLHPDTPLSDPEFRPFVPGDQQVPASELMTYKVIALARLVCPRSNIPSTTALATLNRQEGRELGLVRGANVVMPNLTPLKYRALYEIYPNKACISETGEACYSCMIGRIESLGRRIGHGPGHARPSVEHDQPSHHPPVREA